jgi:hypothetical protein
MRDVNMADLKDKVAVITGASSGIGRAVSLPPALIMIPM